MEPSLTSLRRARGTRLARLASRALLVAALALAGGGGCGLDRSGSVDGGDDGPLPQCRNRIRDLTETDTDCGGSCGPCDDGGRCLADTDCASGRCTAHNCAATFQVDAPRAFLAGPFPTDVVAAEVNGDGRIDLVVSLQSEWTLVTPEVHVAVLAGNGDGTFQAPVGFVAPGFPATLAAADFNGDQLADVVLPDQLTDQVAILLADGAGGLRRSFNVTGASNTTAVATGDFDGDGDADLALVARSVIVLPGDGKGGFGAAVSVAVPSTPRGVAVGDFNGDRRDDVAVGGFGGVSVLLGQRGGLGKASSATAEAADNVLAGDFDHDGKRDLAMIRSNGGAVATLLGNGDGTFRAAPSPSSPIPGNSLLSAADFDGDGTLDVAAADATGGLALLAGKGDGGFRDPTRFFVGVAPTGLAAADLDGDGHPDLAAANAQTDDVTVLLGKGDGRFPRVDTVPGIASPLSLVAADLDGDGRDDLVTGSNGGGVSVHIASGGSFRAPRDYWVGGLPDPLLPVDLDGDGRPELVAAMRFAGQVVVLRNAGDGSFTVGAPVDSSGDPSGLAAGDVDGDGRTDLVVVDHARGEARVLLARGNGFQHLEEVKVGLGAFAPAVCDLDRDGRNDLVVAVAGSARKSLAVLLSRGEAGFAAPVTYPFGSFDADANAAVVHCRDLDGLPGPEIVVIDANSAREKNVSVLTTEPGGVLRTVENTFAGAGLASLSLAPLHPTGRLHALVAGPRGIGLLLGDGSAHFQPALTFRLGGASYGATFGDFNGDGRTDVAAIAEGFPSGAALLLNRAF